MFPAAYLHFPDVEYSNPRRWCCRKILILSRFVAPPGLVNLESITIADNDGVWDTRLAFSRSGVNFSYVGGDRSPFVERSASLGTEPLNSPSEISPGTAWDGSIVSIATGMVVSQGEGLIRLYKFGDALRHGQNNAAKRVGTSGVSLIEMRIDGFASLQSSSGASEAITVPILFADTTLHVNVRTALAATLRVEGLPSNGSLVAAPGHSLSQSIPVRP